MKEYLVLGNSREVFRIATEDILYVSADGCYSQIYLAYGDPIVLRIQFGEIVELMEKLPHTGSSFIRLGRSLVINTSYVCYINFSDEKLALLDRNKGEKVVHISTKLLKELAFHIGYTVKPHNE